MNKSTKIKLWIFGFTMMLIGIVIYSGFQPRNPNKVLKTQMKYFGLDYRIIKPNVTYFRDSGCLTDLDCKVEFDYDDTNNQFQPYFNQMQRLPIKESIISGDYWLKLESGYYLLEQDGHDFTLILFDTLNKKGLLHISII